MPIVTTVDELVVVQLGPKVPNCTKRGVYKSIDTVLTIQHSCALCRLQLMRLAGCSETALSTVTIQLGLTAYWLIRYESTGESI